MATYPTDATVDPATFSVVSSFTNTAAVATGTTSFTLPSVAQSRAEVLVSVDGAVQPTSSYTLDADKEGITFIQAPNPTQSIVIRVISIPNRFLLNRELQDTTAVNFSNGATTSVNGNNYTINANQESFPLAAASNVTSKDEIFVYVSGVFQDSNSFTYPSVALGTQGIDIGDNTATRLLTNFDVDENGTALAQGANNFIDEGYFNSGITAIANANCNTQIKYFGSGSLFLDGIDSYLKIERNIGSLSNGMIYPLLNENFTIEAMANVLPVTARTNATANMTIFAHVQSGYDYYGLQILPNCNVAFRIVNDNVSKEVIGGNVNAGAFYHTAVSYNHNEDNLMLFVNNVLVDSKILGFSESVDAASGKGVTTYIGASGCFAAGTQITMANGDKKSIEDIKVADIVTCFDKNGDIYTSNVSKIFEHENDDTFYSIVHENGELRVTGNHWLLTEDNTFLEAEKFSVGDFLILYQGELSKIQSIQKIEKAKSYNFTVEKYHTYIANDVRVHNKGAGKTGGPGPQFYAGFIDSLRLSKTLKYNTPTIQPMNTAPTIIGGGALGSIQTNDKLSIRAFGMTVTTLDRFSSMEDRKPDKGFQTDERYDVTTFTSQAGYEKRRLKSRRSKRAYSLTYTNITGIEKLAIENFYRARSGDFETFTFDLSHLNDSGTINTRFNGPLSVTQVLSTGTTLVENFYTVSFALQEVFD